MQKCRGMRDIVVRIGASAKQKKLLHRLSNTIFIEKPLAHAHSCAANIKPVAYRPETT